MPLNSTSWTESSVYLNLESRDSIRNLCYGFRENSVHIHLKPPCEVTPLKISVWKDKLKFCNDPKASWALDGIQFGFKVAFSSGMLKSAEENMSSALSDPSVVDDYIKKELDRGSIAGPFSDDPINGLHFNPFGLIPKSAQGEWRMITEFRLRSYS